MLEFASCKCCSLLPCPLPRAAWGRAPEQVCGGGRGVGLRPTCYRQAIPGSPQGLEGVESRKERESALNPPGWALLDTPGLQRGASAQRRPPSPATLQTRSRCRDRKVATSSPSLDRTALDRCHPSPRGLPAPSLPLTSHHQKRQQ